MTPAEITDKANHQLRVENEQLKAVLAQRGANLATEFIEGLGVLVTQTAAGNQGARVMLNLLLDRLEEARALRSNLAVVRDVPGTIIKG